ncbi:OmpA family protein [Cognataquiflexum rubidum]|uniref:OmpA family protein n=1 Tax=Cognataquiflexum rubidum TaxID=2922273 RepID=UPI001F148DFF|nr:OmpA family protein [Cognataquiflexum rubidum]MCH6235476.1 OmpA family protein [Cognataquiflexum rubidum]
MKKLNIKSGLFAHFLVVIFLMSCTSMNNAQKGAVIGAGTGGAAGGLFGSKKGNTAEGAVIGAVIGGAVGAGVGIYMDNQAEKLEQEVKDAEIERVGEAIKVTFDSGILFGFDSYSLTPASQETIMKFAGVLNEYPDTNITINGHTDNRGTHEYNLGLSKQRAESVHNYIKMQKVSSERMVTNGYSYDTPVADNSTDEGRAKNRRVEILITANEALIEKAEKGEIKN